MNTATATSFEMFHDNAPTALYEMELQSKISVNEVQRGQAEIAFHAARSAFRWLATAYPEFRS